MDSSVLVLMLSVSLFLGAIGVAGFMWAIKTGQFDDKEKFLNATKFDSEEDLNDAAKKESKKYRPPD
ncbi:MAG: cbb3-type cytochrome oxidase assembly protein CcoS [Sulfuricurvum sp.]